MSGGVKLILIVLSAVFVNNYVLSQFLGICPFLGVSKRVDTAVGMGLAVIFVMALASAVTYLIQYAILDKFNLGYLQTIVFILVIPALVQFVEMFLQKASPTLYQSLGVYLPLITTNCAVLGVAITNIDRGYNLIETVFNGVGGALGCTMAIVIFAGGRERMELADIPECLKGFPIAMISSGLMALSFLGFQGLIKL